MQHVVIQTTCEESRVIMIKSDPMEAIHYAREAALTFVNDICSDIAGDFPEGEEPPRPEIKETFVTPGRDMYTFIVDVEDFDWMLTVHPVGR